MKRLKPCALCVFFAVYSASYACVLIQCKLCPTVFTSHKDLNEHYDTHFTTGRCGTCDKQLMVINGQYYVLNLHDNANCNKANYDAGALGGGQTTTVATAGYKRPPQQKYNVGENAANDGELKPFEIVECIQLKVDDGWQVQADNNAIIKNLSSTATAALLAGKDLKELPSDRISVKPTGEVYIREFQCTTCGKYLLTRHTLKEHMKCHTRRTNQTQLASTSGILTEDDINKLPADRISVKPSGEKQLREFQCEYCKKYLLSRHTLREHTRRFHLPNSPNQSTPATSAVNPQGGKKATGVHQCQYCGKFELSKGSLQAHIKRYHPDMVQNLGTIVCHICGIVLKSKYALRVHKKTHNTGLKPTK